MSIPMHQLPNKNSVTAEARVCTFCGNPAITQYSRLAVERIRSTEKALQDRIAKLEAALTEIADYDPLCWPNRAWHDDSRYLSRVAQNALDKAELGGE